MADSDEALIAAHARGDPAAFGKLLGRYADGLLGYLQRIGGDRHEAEDLFQETFGKVHAKAGAFAGRGRFKSWLFSIATNAALDARRKRRRRGQVRSLDRNGGCEDRDSVESTMTVVDEKNVDPLDCAAQEEQKARVQQAVAQLPDRQRATLVLAYYQGLSYKEVAETLGCSLGTVKTQMYRALKKLAEALPEARGGVE